MAAAMPPAKRVKISRKTFLQKPLPEPLDLGDEGTADAKRSVYFVTFPHPQKEHSQQGVRLVAPETLAKGAMMDKFLDACGRPEYFNRNCRENAESVPLLQASLFREAHKANAEAVVHKSYASVGTLRPKQCHDHEHAPTEIQRFPQM